MRVQRDQKVTLRSGPDHDLRAGPMQRGLEKLQLESARQRCHRADPKHVPRRSGRTVEHHVHQLLARAANRFRVIEGDSAGLG